MRESMTLICIICLGLDFKKRMSEMFINEELPWFITFMPIHLVFLGITHKQLINIISKALQIECKK